MKSEVLHMKRKFTVLTLVLAMALSAGIGAVAATGSQNISAILSYETKVVYNGVEQTFKDAQGNVVYPVIYNGSTYLPLRAVANMMGEQNVGYDAATKTVTLGKTEKQPTNLVSLKNSGGNEFSWIINDKSELSVVGSDATQTFSTGIEWDIWNSASSTGKGWVLYFDCGGYSEITFSAWSEVDCKVSMFDQNYNVISSFDLTKNSIVSKTITIPAGTTKIAFGGDGAGYGDDFDGALKILDPIVK